MISVSTKIITDSTGFENCGNYYYYSASSGQPPRLYQQILSRAKKSIDIWDPYFTVEAAKIFDEITQSNININILTKLKIVNKYDTQAKEEIDKFADEIKNILRRNGITPNLSIYCYIVKKFEKDWHDRYLIIDEIDAYLVGTSINEQISAVKDFGIHQISNPSERDFIIQKMKACKESCNHRGYNPIGYHRH